MRFPEFEGEWEHTKIRHILTIGNGRDYKHLKSGEIPVFGTGGYMTSVNEYLMDGETVCIGRKGTINKPFYYSGKFWTVDTLFYTYSYKKALPKFVFYVFQNTNWMEYNEASGVPSLSKKTIEQIDICIPTLSEQNKIASLLSLLDERIETQSKIIEKYESLIKGITDFLFRNKNCLCKSAHLGSLCSIKKGEQVNTLELTNTGSYYVMNGGMLPSGYYSNYNTSAHTISISEGGNSCGYVQYNSSKFWSGGHCYTLNEVSKQVFNKYLYYYLKSQEKNIQALRVGSGLPNIQKKDLERFKIQFPSHEEQERIVKILTQFSRKIEVEHSLLYGFQKQKGCLLQQMFI